MYSARYSCQILCHLNFCDRFFRNPRIPNLMKIRPVGAVLFHANWERGRRTDGWTKGHDEVYGCFSRFWKLVHNFRTSKGFQVSEMLHCVEN